MYRAPSFGRGWKPACPLTAWSQMRSSIAFGVEVCTLRGDERTDDAGRGRHHRGGLSLAKIVFRGRIPGGADWFGTESSTHSRAGKVGWHHQPEDSSGGAPGAAARSGDLWACGRRLRGN